MGMADQLQYQKKFNEHKAKMKEEAAAKAAGGAGSGDKGGDDFKELTPQELGKLGMAEQLQY